MLRNIYEVNHRSIRLWTTKFDAGFPAVGCPELESNFVRFPAKFDANFDRRIPSHNNCARIQISATINLPDRHRLHPRGSDRISGGAVYYLLLVWVSTR